MHSFEYHKFSKLEIAPVIISKDYMGKQRLWNVPGIIQLSKWKELTQMP